MSLIDTIREGQHDAVTNMLDLRTADRDLRRAPNHGMMETMERPGPME
jgi:hypothetical protein